MGMPVQRGCMRRQPLRASTVLHLQLLSCHDCSTCFLLAQTGPPGLLLLLQPRPPRQQRLPLRRRARGQQLGGPLLHLSHQVRLAGQGRGGGREGKGRRQQDGSQARSGACWASGGRARHLAAAAAAAAKQPWCAALDIHPSCSAAGVPGSRTAPACAPPCPAPPAPGAPAQIPPAESKQKPKKRTHAHSHGAWLPGTDSKRDQDHPGVLCCFRVSAAPVPPSKAGPATKPRAPSPQLPAPAPLALALATVMRFSPHPLISRRVAADTRQCLGGRPCRREGRAAAGGRVG